MLELPGAPDYGAEAPGADILATVPSDLRVYVDQEAEAQYVRQVARKIAQQREHAAASEPLPPTFDGWDLIANAKAIEPDIVEKLIPASGRLLIAGQAKAGKSSLALHVVACLLDPRGRYLFGRYPVKSDPLRVYYIDAELGHDRLALWLANLDLPEWAVRGRLAASPLPSGASFNVFSPENRAAWVERIRAHQTDVLLVDCASPILAAAGVDENSNSEVRAYLDQLNHLRIDAGARLLILLHHQGKGGQAGPGSRGASAFLDFPEVLWSLSVEAEDDNYAEAPRFLRTRGRLGSHPGGMLTWRQDGNVWGIEEGFTPARWRAEQKAARDAIGGRRW